MSKKWLNILGVLVLVGIMLMPTIHSYANESENVDVGIQESACEAYDELMNSFPESYSTGKRTYPDYYGGSYINDNGQLVVYVTELEIAPITMNNTDSSVVSYQECEYSYNDLNAIMDVLNEYKFAHSESAIAKNFNYYALLDEQNRIEVQLDDCSENKIQEFKDNVYSSEAITFVKAEKPMELYASLCAGDRISSYASGTSYYTGSIGYRAKRNGKIGIVTAGHVIDANDSLYTGVGATVIGKCLTSYNSNGNYDDAFCEITNSSYSPSNTISGTSNALSTTISEPGVGTTVNKVGASSGHTSGKITSINATVSYSNGKTLTNMTQVSLFSEGGDSGGIFYSYVSSSNTRYTLGILTGGNGTTTSYSKANNINAGLETSRY